MGKERLYISHTNTEIKGFFADYRFLSNFHLAAVYLDGILYPSTENAYHAAKTLDIKERVIFETVTPSESKKLGRKVTLRQDWEEVKRLIMLSILTDKFTRYPELRLALLNTNDKYLEETNHWKDTYWGVCDGIGENMLGKLLMNIRTGIN